jgi:hypothetical protein
LAALPRLLYTQNPFYLISALLVLYGIYVALGPESSTSGGWLLLGLLGGYTLALALAGLVIVRFGQVWDDARTILLAICLLFVALSAGFDRIVLDNPLAGARLLLLSLLYVVLISEGVLRGLQLRFSSRYRGPYYLILCLLFCYPIGLGLLSKAGCDARMPLFVFLFPVAVSLVFLTLLPAARVAGRGEPAPGSGWTWPWYPWSLFAILLIATGLRSYSFSLGFESGHAGASSFQPFFLLPLCFAGAFLFLELSIAAKNATARDLALVAQLGFVALAMTSKSLNPVAAQFLMTVSHTVGSPAQMTVVGLAIFYAIAWIRGMRLGEIGLVVCIGLFSVIDRQTTSLDTLSSPRWLPLAIVALGEFSLGLWRRTSWRQLLGMLFGIAAFASADWIPRLPQESQIHHWPLAVIIALLLGAPWARLMRRFAWAFIPFVGMLAAWDGTNHEAAVPKWLEAVYLICFTALAAAYWYRTPSVRRFVAAAAMLLVLLGVNARWLYLGLQESRIALGLPWLAWGSASMAFALLVSFLKGGLIGNLSRRLRSFGPGTQTLGHPIQDDAML